MDRDTVEIVALLAEGAKLAPNESLTKKLALQQEIDKARAAFHGLIVHLPAEISLHGFTAQPKSAGQQQSDPGLEE